MTKILLSQHEFNSAKNSDQWCFVDSGNAEIIKDPHTNTTYVIPKYELQNGDDFLKWEINQIVEFHNQSNTILGKVITYCLHETFIEVFFKIN